MKRKFFIITVIALLMAFSASLQAQDDKNEKDMKKDKESKSNVHLKVDKNTIPKNVKPGETFTINVDVSNKSKSTEWNSSNLNFEVESPFTLTGSTLSKLSLSPGEYGTIQINVKAPDTEGKELLKITASDNGKKSKQFVKNITVGTAKSDSDDDDSGDVNKDKDKDKEKNKEREKGNKNEKGKKND